VGNASRRSRTYPDLAGTSLWLFKDDSTLRLHMYSIVTSRWFDYVMFSFIVLNCVAMAYEYPHMSRENLDGAILFWRCASMRQLIAADAAIGSAFAVECSRSSERYDPLNKTGTAHPQQKSFLLLVPLPLQ
jgi:hypothetical protein